MEKMKCRNCGELFTEKNPPMIFLDIGREEEVAGDYYCGAECFVEWVFGFAICHFGEEYVNSLLERVNFSLEPTQHRR